MTTYATYSFYTTTFLGTAIASADAIQSEAIGQNSVTYAGTSSKMRTAGETYMQSAALYLGSTGLMFPGFSSGEYSGLIDED